jgi:hypothetical protein
MKFLLYHIITNILKRRKIKIDYKSKKELNILLKKILYKNHHQCKIKLDNIILPHMQNMRNNEKKILNKPSTNSDSISSFVDTTSSPISTSSHNTVNSMNKIDFHNKRLIQISYNSHIIPIL